MLSQIHIIIEILSNFKDFLYMVEGDTENQFKKSGKFSQAIKSVSKNLNYYHKLTEEERQRILMNNIEIQAGCFKKLCHTYFFTITFEAL